MVVAIAVEYGFASGLISARSANATARSARKRASCIFPCRSTLQAALWRGGADDLSVQYRNGTAHLLPPLRYSRLLRAALRPRSDQRQRALSRRHRSLRAEAQPLF